MNNNVNKVQELMVLLCNGMAFFGKFKIFCLKLKKNAFFNFIYNYLTDRSKG